MSFDGMKEVMTVTSLYLLNTSATSYIHSFIHSFIHSRIYIAPLQRFSRLQHWFLTAVYRFYTDQIYIILLFSPLYSFCKTSTWNITFYIYRLTIAHQIFLRSRQCQNRKSLLFTELLWSSHLILASVISSKSTLHNCYMCALN